MKHLSKIFILVFIALLGLSSCGSDEPEGKWDKMKWTNVNNLMNVNGVYLLPEEGGTYTFLCRNYEHPWFNSFLVDGVQQNPDNENRMEFHGEWCTLIFEGNKLTITAQPLPASLEVRNIDVRVTAGDIFDSLNFSQRKDIHY